MELIGTTALNDLLEKAKSSLATSSLFSSLFAENDWQLSSRISEIMMREQTKEHDASDNEYNIYKYVIKDNLEGLKEQLNKFKTFASVNAPKSDELKRTSSGEAGNPPSISSPAKRTQFSKIVRSMSKIPKKIDFESVAALTINADHMHRNTHKRRSTSHSSGMMPYGSFDDNAAILKTDAIGGTIIHLAYLRRNYKIGRWLVENYPVQSLLPYSKKCTEIVKKELKKELKRELTEEELEKEMPYTGCNILHITIIQKNHAETRWLLDFYRDHKHSVQWGLETLLLEDTTGKFFSDRNGPFYFGCFPLHFAVCSNDTDMFDLILSYTSSLDGNALNNHKKAYSALLEQDKLQRGDSHKDGATKGDNMQAISTTPAIVVPSTTTKKIITARGYLGDAVIFMRDQGGNSCLHLAVIHHLHDMYKHVKKTAEAMLKKEINLGYTDKLIEVGEADIKGTTFELKPLPRSSDNSNEKWNNGFRYGYSPRETTIRIPFAYVSRNDSQYKQWLQEETDRKLQQRLLLVLNEDLHSPQTLSAAGLKDNKGTDDEERKESETNAFLISQMKVLRWSYGPVQCSLVDLEGLDLPHKLERYRGSNIRELPSDARRRMFGAIEWICITDSDQSITIPEVKKLITEKWKRFGEMIFLLRFYIHVFITLFITIMACFINVSPKWYCDTLAEVAVTLLYPLTAIAITALLVYEIPCILRIGLEYWGYSSSSEYKGVIRGAAKFNNTVFSILALSFAFLCAEMYGLTVMFLIKLGILLLVGFWISTKYFRLKTKNGHWILKIYDLFKMKLGVTLLNSILIITIMSTLFIGLSIGFSVFDNMVSSVSNKFLNISNPILVEVKDTIVSTASTVTGGNESSTLLFVPIGDLGLKLSMTICVVTTWIYLFFFLMGLDGMGEFVISIYRIVSRDVPFFLIFYFVVLIAFGIAISMLTNSGNPDSYYGFWVFLRAVWGLVQITVNMDCDDPVLDIKKVPENLLLVAEVVFTMFYMSVVLLMLNLLIAMVNNTYSELMKCSESVLLIEKYNIMCGFSQSLQAFERYFPSLFVGEEDYYPTDTEHDASPPPTPPLPVKSSFFNIKLNMFSARELPKMYGILLDSEEYNTDDTTIGDTYIERYAFEIQESVDDWYESKDVAAASDRQKKTVLLIIDPQNDFHEGEGNEDPSYNKTRDQALKLYHAPGSLAVPRANEDSRRIRDMINEHVNSIDEIIVTMDSHFKTHIAHAVCWECGPRCQKCDPKKTVDRCSPTPFTTISSKDIVEGVWAPVEGLQDKEWCLKYTEELERKGKLMLCIWPEHCIIGSYGHAIVPDLNVALQHWAKTRNKAVTYVMKGQNCRTEMYSALKAEVEDPKDPRTALNEELLVKLKIADRVIICGQALSHCVNYTVRDILNFWHHDHVSKLVLVEDGCSPVPGFEGVGEDFVRDIKERGMTVVKASEVFLTSKQEDLKDVLRNIQGELASLRSRLENGTSTSPLLLLPPTAPTAFITTTPPMTTSPTPPTPDQQTPQETMRQLHSDVLEIRKQLQTTFEAFSQHIEATSPTTTTSSTSTTTTIDDDIMN